MHAGKKNPYSTPAASAAASTRLCSLRLWTNQLPMSSASAASRMKAPTETAKMTSTEPVSLAASPDRRRSHNTVHGHGFRCCERFGDWLLQPHDSLCRPADVAEARFAVAEEAVGELGHARHERKGVVGPDRDVDFVADLWRIGPGLTVSDADLDVVGERQC